jgi:hypothetical protein
MKAAPVAWSLVAVVLLAGSVGRAQSLSDIAKKTDEDRRKAGKAPTKVYTNDDLRAYPMPPAPPDASAPTGSEGAPPSTATPAPGDQPAEGGVAKPAEKDEGPGKDASYWKGQLSNAETKLQRDQSYRDALDSRINALTNDFYARSDPAQRATIWSQRTKALEELERVKKDITDGQAAIAKIREDARKAGVPPGSLR